MNMDIEHVDLPNIEHVTATDNGVRVSISSCPEGLMQASVSVLDEFPSCRIEAGQYYGTNSHKWYINVVGEHEWKPEAASIITLSGLSRDQMVAMRDALTKALGE